MSQDSEPSVATPESSNQSLSSIPAVPPPWTLKGDVYLFSFWTSRSQARDGLPDMTYSPLEGASSYASSGKPVGGLSMIQVIRYHTSPVGPYDEMILVPGSFEYERENAQGKRETRRGPRISRIYVSQKHTCYNGRLNWNVPKHLARFHWTDGPDGSTSVKVFPHDTHPENVNEATASPEPFFQTTFKPVRYMPAFPLATRWLDFLGFKTTLVQPPLPSGPSSQGELPGTDRWCSVVPLQYSSRSMVGWFDIEQENDSKGKTAGESQNFWPGLGRWHMGLKMENAEVIFDDPEEVWDAPRSNL